MQLLDLIIPGQPYRRHRHRWDDDELVSTVKDSVSDIKDTVSDTINVAKDSLVDSLSSAAPLQGSINSGSDASTLIWAIVAVLVVLGICLWFALSYRRRFSTSH